MKNYFIKLLGGVTATEFAEIFSTAAKEHEILVEQIKFFQAQCKVKDDRIDYLNDLIFMKTGFVSSEPESAKVMPSFQPISSHQSWQSIKNSLIRKDRELMRKRDAN